ncbi:hypothetical protein [Streptomyces xanthii]|uniref:Gram-positive cocci surface proteins LPxTG domain-containing protein n=1 Tax=Streptomyces xanthii TaxID=2768069 RepID=A0A7H1B9B9_9ACTN|nr:hypothetical protein [Streptomyces xanthii]QNS05324.1 hypothetical protein IAG42_18120 [Streptomyces xanthii]
MAWLRRVAGRVTGALAATLLVLTASLPAAAACALVSAVAQASPAYAAEPSPGASLAGTQAGEGRTPPGRPRPHPTGPAALRPPAPPVEEPSATPTHRPRPPAAARQQTVVPDDGTSPLVNVLPLGFGLLLTGLGLGFLALRLRR